MEILYKLLELIKKYLVELIFDKLIQFIKSESLNLPQLYTKSKSHASLEEIATVLSKHIECSDRRLMSILSRAYWDGEFENKRCISPTRLLMLEYMYNNVVQQEFIFIYPNIKAPTRDEKLSNGDYLIDRRPFLYVPDAHPENWTNQNCQKAFKVLSDEPEGSNLNSIWPEYVTEEMYSSFSQIRIMEKDLLHVLKKEKIQLPKSILKK